MSAKTSAAKTTSPEFTGRHMWMLMIGFFGVIVTVNIGMAVLSSTTWTGLVVSNSYVASQEFETKRIAHEKQMAAGWASTLTFENGAVTLKLVDGAGTPVDLSDVTVKVNRPVGGHDDQTLTLVRAADGTYTAPLNLGAGVWDAHVTTAETALGPYELFERFTAKGN